jgi:hypothetical protein
VRLPPLTPSVAMPRGHLDLHARNAAPWDAGTSLDGTVVVVGTDLAVLDGQGEGNPGGGEGGHAGVDARALVKGEAEHTDGLWCCCVVLWSKVKWYAKRCVQELLEVPAFAWSGECLEKKELGRKVVRRARRLIRVTRGVRRGTE